MPKDYRVSMLGGRSQYKPSHAAVAVGGAWSAMLSAYRSRPGWQTAYRNRPRNTPTAISDFRFLIRGRMQLGATVIGSQDRTCRPGQWPLPRHRWHRF